MKNIRNLLAGISLLASMFAFSKPAFATFGLGINGGMEVFPLVTNGIDVFYDMGRFTFGAHYAAGSGDLKDLAEAGNVGTTAINIESLDATSTVMSFDARMFLLFGMNVFVGLGQRTIDLEFDLRDTTLGLTADGKIETETSISRVGFGTMGRFGVFYIGFDLFAAQIAASGKSTSTLNSSIPAAATELQSEFDDLDKFADDLSTQTWGGGAILSVGALL